MAVTAAAHQREIGLVADAAAATVRQRARQADPDDIDGWWRSAGPGLERTVRQAFTLTAALAGEYLLTEAAMAGFPGLEPVLAVLDAAQMATALRVTGPVAFKTNLARSGSVDVAVRVMGDRLAGSATRLTLAGSRETMFATAEANPSTLVGYRRVAQSGACKFCEMLAGRGAVYLSRESAGRVVGRNGRVRGSRPIGRQFHDSCRCRVEEIWADGVRVVEPEPSPVVEPDEIVEPAPRPEPEVVDSSPAQRVLDARQRFREEPGVPRGRFSQRDVEGNRVPTPETFARERLRQDVGVEADDVIRQRMRDSGFLTEDEARERASEAIRRRNEAEDVWLAGSGRSGTKAHRAYIEAEQELMDAQTALFRAREDFAKEYQAEMRALLDEVGIERGGVPGRDLVANYDRVEPGLRGRIDDALALYPTEWLQRSAGRERFEVIHESRRAFMRPAGLTRDAQMNLAADEGIAIIAHEFGHQMENLSYEIRRAEWALYWRRAGGDQLQSLADLTGGGYRPDEMTRVDEWPSPYMGKSYEGASASSNYEIWSMAAEHFLPDVPSTIYGTRADFWADEDLRQWFLGVLLTA